MKAHLAIETGSKLSSFPMVTEHGLGLPITRVILSLLLLTSPSSLTGSFLSLSPPSSYLSSFTLSSYLLFDLRVSLPESSGGGGRGEGKSHPDFTSIIVASDAQKFMAFYELFVIQRGVAMWTGEVLMCGGGLRIKIFFFRSNSFVDRMNVCYGEVFYFGREWI